MNEEAASLLTYAAYTRFERPPVRDANAIMKRAICSLGFLEEAAKVTEHFPEPFHGFTALLQYFKKLEFGAQVIKDHRL